jgi:hypothetical protein
MPQGGNGAPLWNADLKLGACGDWCMAARIEDAWLSGHELADRVVETLGTHNTVVHQCTVVAHHWVGISHIHTTRCRATMNDESTAITLESIAV